jgi:hypothetical protein
MYVAQRPCWRPGRRAVSTSTPDAGAGRLADEAAAMGPEFCCLSQQITLNQDCMPGHAWICRSMRIADACMQRLESCLLADS